jgi:hypothetical protein
MVILSVLEVRLEVKISNPCTKWARNCCFDVSECVSDSVPGSLFTKGARSTFQLAIIGADALFDLNCNYKLGFRPLSFKHQRAMQRFPKR